MRIQILTQMIVIDLEDDDESDNEINDDDEN
jgi:hypothetical protein